MPEKYTPELTSPEKLPGEVAKIAENNHNLKSLIAVVGELPNESLKGIFNLD